MGLEKASYRDNLERISAMYPTLEMLNLSQVTAFIGKDRRTVIKLFSFDKHNYISKAKLAREMS